MEENNWKEKVRDFLLGIFDSEYRRERQIRKERECREELQRMLDEYAKEHNL